MRIAAPRRPRTSTATLWLGAALLAGGIAGGCGAQALPAPATSAAIGARGDGDAPRDEPAKGATGGRCGRQEHEALPIALRHGSGGSGSVALARADGGALYAYVAREDDDAISVIDVAQRREIAALPVAGGPSQLVVLADGRVAVSLRRANEIAIFEPSAAHPWAERCRAGVAHAEPIGLATSADGTALYVASGWGAALSTFGTRDLDARGSVALPREPRAIVQPRAGGPVFVSHAVGSVVSRVDVGDDGRPSAANAVELLAKRVDPGNSAVRSFGVNQGFALVSDGSRLFLPGATVSSDADTFTDGYGGSERPVRPTVRVLDVASAEPVFRGMGLDRFDRPIDECVLPRAADVGEGSKLYVACANVDAVVELDGRVGEPASYELRRFLVPAGPTGLAVDPRSNLAVTWSPTKEEVGVLDLRIGATVAVAVSRRAEPRWSPREARGRSLFRDGTEPRISFDGRACESCHPDGRDDGLTWSTPDGPRQTISLAGRVDASRGTFGWLGDHRTLEEHLRHTMKRLGGVGFSRPVDRDDLASLTAWLHAMPAPTEVARPEADAAVVARGREAFESVGCAKCHEAGDADGRAHDVGTGNPIERSLAFDTPSLRGIAGSAPYMHDGSFGTLDALLAKAGGPMGAAKSLDDADRAAIGAYMKSLAPAPTTRVAGGPLVAPALGDAVPVARAPETGPFQKMMRGLSSGHSGRALEPFDLDALPVDDVDHLPQSVWVEYPIDPEIVRMQTTSAADPARDGVTYDHGKLRFSPSSWGMLHEGPVLYALSPLEPVVSISRKNRFVDASWWRFDAVPGGGDDVRFRRAETYVDHERGEVLLRDRVDVLARPVKGTSVFAYLRRCVPCVPDEQLRVFLVGRSASSEDLSVDTLPIRRGSSASARIQATTLDAVPTWKAGSFQDRKIHDVVLEASWAENEDRPSVYVSVLR